MDCRVGGRHKLRFRHNFTLYIFFVVFVANIHYIYGVHISPFTKMNGMKDYNHLYIAYVNNDYAGTVATAYGVCAQQYA